MWNLQRQEDAIAAELGKDVTDPAVRNAVKERLGDIPVPPKYGSGDFLRTSYWRHRGKLDVPKERFISYPTATRDDDGTLLPGWPAGTTARTRCADRRPPRRGRVGRRTAAAVARRWPKPSRSQGLSTPATRALLKRLVERGDLVQKGQKRGTRYELATS